MGPHIGSLARFLFITGPEPNDVKSQAKLQSMGCLIFFCPSEWAIITFCYSPKFGWCFQLQPTAKIHRRILPNGAPVYEIATLVNITTMAMVLATYITVVYYLVGGIPTPLKKYEFVSWDHEIPNIWKTKNCYITLFCFKLYLYNHKNISSPLNHQPVIHIPYIPFIFSIDYP